MATAPQPAVAQETTKQKQVRGSYQPKAIQTEVIALAILGKSISRIARETGIDRRTVRRVLKDNEVAQLQNVAGARLDAVLPQSASLVCERIIEKNDHNCALAVLKGRGVLKSDNNTTVNLMTNGNVIMGLWPEFAGPLESAHDPQANSKALPAKPGEVLCQTRTEDDNSAT